MHFSIVCCKPTRLHSNCKKNSFFLLLRVESFVIEKAKMYAFYNYFCVVLNCHLFQRFNFVYFIAAFWKTKKRFSESFDEKALIWLDLIKSLKIRSKSQSCTISFTKKTFHLRSLTFKNQDKMKLWQNIRLIPVISFSHVVSWNFSPRCCISHQTKSEWKEWKVVELLFLNRKNHQKFSVSMQLRLVAHSSATRN